VHLVGIINGVCLYKKRMEWTTLKSARGIYII
jgi:hypothetical protein